ncbi:hypothetical protein K9U39_09995 [Rhodoblastus acidophilus]|uniref:Transmembrane protein n=1 Tax=Candidatus Rhodoblastus alkanivorans TaxID=2954117 RepID=A0ABS9Z8J4_9HYPH|nr:hypothetical protein [Candidatus Rhodoblastus alkanivorans]MCI4679499.1 hypothetical protein [Candidatus Rhodoblastus alkanivorans]MCI4683944.1 hypothetical protein [Candidatus Rhodoblastus alkanivorans]MDI4641263.1 hypothetical protein [Rhodoblastus acidophilus]
MLLAIRLFWLTLAAAAAHFHDGLAYPTVLLAALIAWRGWGPWWILPVIVAEAVYASDLFASASGGGKLPGAMSNVFFQLIVFALLALIGFAAGWTFRRRDTRT